MVMQSLALCRWMACAPPPATAFSVATETLMTASRMARPFPRMITETGENGAISVTFWAISTMRRAGSNPPSLRRDKPIENPFGPNVLPRSATE